MKRPVRELYSILVRTALLVPGIWTSGDSQNIAIDPHSEEPMSPIQSKSLEQQMDSGYLYKSYNMDRQGIEQKNSNLLMHEANEPIDLSIRQSAGTKRPAQIMEEAPKSITKSSRLETDDVNINKIEQNINAWNNSRLCDKHRATLHLAYKPAVVLNIDANSGYIRIYNENYKSKIKTHLRSCIAAYSIIPTQNEMWFAIISRSSRMHIKLADCQVIDKNSSEYKYIEELSGYYPGLLGDIIDYMDKHGPIISNRYKIKNEWTETLGDIYVRESIRFGHTIGKEPIIIEKSGNYGPLAAAVQMIFSLSEVHNDLYNLSARFIEKALKDVSLKHLLIVKALYEIAKKSKSSEKMEINEQYAILCSIFSDAIQKQHASPESIAIQIYTEMHESLAKFYEKAKVCEELLGIEKKKKMSDKEYYLLAGKCIIKPQKYIKCTTTVSFNRPASENIHTMKEEINKWTISSNIEKHYHIHYVDNTKQKYTRVCMPMRSEEYVHTIGQIVEYLKRLYNIEKEECICPYKRNSSGDWMYILEEERDKTVQEFIDYDIVFYYIEEGVRENYFTFAEFESYIQPEVRAVRIPLFLSPMIRSAVDMGPFEEADKKKHTLVGNMRFMAQKAGVYAYNPKYIWSSYSFVHHYYSSLHIRRDNADIPTIDCYIMDSKAAMTNDTAIVEWYAKIRNSVDEYMHCILSDDLTNDQDKYSAFSKAVKTQEYTLDSVFLGFYMQSSPENTNELNGVGCSTDHYIGKNVFSDFKLRITPIHMVFDSPKIVQMQYKIDKMDKELEQIDPKSPNVTEKQKKKRKYINTTKSTNRQKLKEMQLKDRPYMEKEFSAAPLPSCVFLVFRHSNTRTKSDLGAHNEILNALTRRYNI